MRLAFDDSAQEAEFRRRDDEAATARRRIGLVIGAAVYALFGFLDPSVAGADSEQLIPIRAVVLLWLVAAAVGISTGWRWRLPLMYSAVVGAAWGLDLMAFVAGNPPREVTQGNMVAVMALYTVMGVRSNLIAPLGGLILAGWAVAAAFHGGDVATVVSNAVFMVSVLTFGAVAAYMLEGLRRADFLKELSLEEERERSDRLLHNILPEEIAARLRIDPAAIAEGSDAVTVVFADVVGFTPMAEHLPPTALVKLLDELFSEFDAVCQEHGVEKIKTIGDAYMAVAGVPIPDPDHAESAARVAIDFLGVADRFQGWPGHLELRVGLSSGPAVAGVIGRNKFAYDLWGDTVNTASRMESHGNPGQIQVSQETRKLLDGAYRFTGPFQTAVKGKGNLTTYFLQAQEVQAQEAAGQDPMSSV